MAILQEYQHLKDKSVVVRVVAEPLSDLARDRESYAHREPLTSQLQFPDSVMPSTSSTTFPSSPQARLHIHGGPTPLLNVVPSLLSPSLLSARSHYSLHRPPTTANMQPLGLMVSVDDPLTEGSLGSAAQLAMRRPANDEEID
ncbi:hypothetical protein PAXINDRAFT_103382 [Paxillus involutus ATCC 200175]|uniref:Uncharacterized protein n=1 Tax=Paxillus involutus ATCC 200175 TaxID=664439 RepID=A0A0C9TDX4_PAXIN|nr:hypothetical protein PAXINDRAFT_103382 [Paxillus involutus ATCC 200175]